MYIFQVPKMSCGGCANTITNAIKQIDETALVEIDLAARTVKVDSAKAETELTAAMTGAGYPPA